MLVSGKSFATDNDSDGYPAGGGIGADCNDADAAINPDEQEVLGDGIDDDCDGNDALVRKLVERGFPSTAWTAVGSVTWPDADQVTVGGSLTATSILSKTFSMGIHYGRLHAVLQVSDNQADPSAKCDLRVKTAQWASPYNTSWAEWQISGEGTGTLLAGDLNVQPAPRVLKEIQIKCDPLAQVTVDWLSLQNTDDVLPPASEMSVTWEDLGMPGGGYATAMVAVGPSSSALDGYLFATSDVGGVARKDTTGATEWEPINGTGTDALLTQPELSAYDVLPTSWGELYVITGRDYFGTPAGGLFVSANADSSAVTWSVVADSYADTASPIPVAAVSRTDACGTGTTQMAAGKLLAEEPDALGVYIANHVVGAEGLDYYDGTEVCELACPSAICDLPADTIAAIARAETVAGSPVMLVGFRTATVASSALYVCELPVDTGGIVDLDCTNADEVKCVAVPWPNGVDVRDIEVDVLDPSIVYVASGGDDATASVCDEGGHGGVFEFLIGEDSEGNLVLEDEPTEISAGISVDGIASLTEVSGLSMDPDGDFLFAFVPPSIGSLYPADRIYRVARSDIDGSGTEPWQATNGDDAGDPAERASGIVDLTGGWLEAQTVAKPRPYPENFAPGRVIDAVWYDSAASACTGETNWQAALATGLNMWSVAGLDYLDGCDTAGTTWNPELDTEWTFWPENTGASTWQFTSAKDIAIDTDGNIFVPVGDLGMFQLPVGETQGEVDCLWDTLNAGGASVATTPDGATWVSFFDEGGGIPDLMGVFRTKGTALGGVAGTDWEYQMGPLTTTNEMWFDAIASGDGKDRLLCKDLDVSHPAFPFGNKDWDDEGNAFSDVFLDPEDGYSKVVETWGMPLALDAYSVDIAVVGFTSYTYDDGTKNVDVTGRIAYTLDGGISWDPVEFEPYYRPLGERTGIYCSARFGCECSEWDFYNALSSVALLKQTDRTYYNSSTDWNLSFFASSSYLGSSAAVSPEHCALAKIDVGSGGTVWTWYDLEPTAADPQLDCNVNGDVLAGVATANWGDQAFIWGNYRRSGSQHDGGVCSVSIDDDDVVEPITPATSYRHGIGAVAPHPSVSGTLAVAPSQTASTWSECMEVAAGSPPRCEGHPLPLLIDQSGPNWMVTTPADK